MTLMKINVLIHPLTDDKPPAVDQESVIDVFNELASNNLQPHLIQHLYKHTIAFCFHLLDTLSIK